MELEITEGQLGNLAVGGISERILFNNIKHKIDICDITIDLKNISCVSDNVFGFGLFTYMKIGHLWNFHTYLESPINEDGKVCYEGISLPIRHLFFKIKNKLYITLPSDVHKCILIQVHPK